MLVAENTAVGRHTVTDGLITVSLQPILSVTVSVEVYTPAATNVCDIEGTVVKVDVPSPKSHPYPILKVPGTPVLASENTVVSGQHPLGGETVNAATGFDTSI